ncbi:hypothetical protein EIL87_25815 [Saccharopolyspora rhizosphaerae]|uniref:Uncharacterized protein n=1 Tax=Saccharopolyspora rhizosphaerae TaxID=2492662 RepID=A0A426JIW3_9PSEU|nr:hypothetical protein [Saccharopolyspora rhizosphaerae]RRO13067.1 hypothetical protein EIL87_25815 [Saccharopolyspora rhizosphaerae]
MTPPDAVNPYGAAPPPPPGGPPGRPRTVDLAFWAGIACPVIGFVMLAMSFASINDAELQVVLDQAGATGQRTLTLDEARALFRVTLAVVAVFCLVLAGLWIMFLVFMRNGRNWARIVITVVGALWFLLTVPTVIGGATTSIVTALVAVLQLAAIAATVIYAYTGDANRYFQPR